MRKIELIVVTLLAALAIAIAAVFWSLSAYRNEQSAWLEWHRHAQGCLKEIYNAVNEYQSKYAEPPVLAQRLFDTGCILPGGWLGASRFGVAGGFEPAADERWTLVDETLVRNKFLEGRVRGSTDIVAVLLPPKDLTYRTLAITLDGTVEPWQGAELKERMEEWHTRTGGLKLSMPAAPKR